MFFKRSNFQGIEIALVTAVPLSLAIFFSFACTQSPTATNTSPSRIYFNETIEPCTVKLVADVEPCSPLADGYFDPHFPGGGINGISQGSVDTAPMIADPLAYTLHGRETLSDSAHILVRGVFIPGTMRCGEFEVESRKAKFITPSDYKYMILPCFADFAVSEYVYGAGPPKITLRASSRSVSYDRTAEKLETLVKEYYESNTAGRERVYGLAPSYRNLAVEAWGTTDRWDVYKDECGKPVVADLGLLEFVEGFAPDMTQEKRGRFVWTPEEFKQDVAKLMGDFTKRSKGRIWHDASAHSLSVDSLEDLPRLMTNIYDLHPHYRDELGVYDGSAATPVAPAPAPGEPHPYPRPPWIRPAPTETPGPSAPNQRTENLTTDEAEGRTTIDGTHSPTRQDVQVNGLSQSDRPCLPEIWGLQHAGPPGAPGPAGPGVPREPAPPREPSQPKNQTSIEVLDAKYSTSKVFWNASGLNIFIVGSGFQPREAVTLAVRLDDVIGNTVANDLGAFAVDLALDAKEYAVGEIYSVVATGDNGSIATIALAVVEQEDPD